MTPLLESSGGRCSDMIGDHENQSQIVKQFIFGDCILTTENDPNRTIDTSGKYPMFKTKEEEFKSEKKAIAKMIRFQTLVKAGQQEAERMKIKQRKKNEKLYDKKETKIFTEKKGYKIMGENMIRQFRDESKLDGETEVIVIVRKKDEKNVKRVQFEDKH